MAACYAVISGLCGVVSFLASASAGHSLLAALMFYILAGLISVMLLAGWHSVRPRPVLSVSG